MTSILLKDITKELELERNDPEERFITNKISWEQYEVLLEKFADTPWCRVTYLEGTLEIISPSRRHEKNKTNIGMFLEVYFQETKTPFWGLGSTTFRIEEKRGGTEPDECYCIGTEKEFPDLVIEVVISNSGVDKLSVYQKLGIQEVWFWEKNKFSIYHLQEKGYEQIFKSKLLPNLDLEMLAKYVIRNDSLEAILEFRNAINLMNYQL